MELNQLPEIQRSVSERIDEKPEPQWYYLDGDQEHGPITPEALQSLFSAGSIPSSSYVFREGMSDWVEADSLEQFTAGNHQKTKRVTFNLPALLLLCFGVAIVAIFVLRSQRNESALNSRTQEARQSTASTVARLPRPVVGEPVEITVSEKSDERLFLMNMLEDLYMNLPRDFSNPQACRATLESLRYEATRHYEDIKQKSLDARLQSVFADFVGVVDNLLNELRAERREGVVFKRLDALYQPGQPNSGGPQLKHKFVATLSAVVSKLNLQRSVEVRLSNGKGWISVGNVTIPANHPVPKVGAVVEVRYLYAFKESNTLYQPVYLGLRSDVEQHECVLSQLKFKGEEEE